MRRGSRMYEAVRAPARQGVGRLRRFWGVAAVFLAAAVVGGAVQATPAWAASGVSAVSVTGSGSGYVSVVSGGSVRTFGAVTNHGGPTGFTGSIVGIAVTADGQGYAAISSVGQVYAYGTVPYRGNPTGFTGSIVGITVTADGQGYAAISSVGQVYAYGTVAYRGNPTGFTGSIVGITVTADGQGYAAISSVGQVYAYGTVAYRGNPTGFTGSIVGIAVTADGQGYAAISSVGQVYAYGTVTYRANATGIRYRMTGLAVTSNGSGYVGSTDTGQVHVFGTVIYRGDVDDPNPPQGQHLNANIYTYWRFTGSGFYNIDQIMWPGSRASDTYWALYWIWSDSGYGYLGLQTNGSRFDGTSGDTAIFSLWNANSASGPHCGQFGGEGAGYSCRLAYAISTDGRQYRLRVWRLNADTGGQWWGAWVQDSATGVDTYLGQIRVTASHTTIASASNFVEYFGSPVGCDSVPRSTANWTQPAANSNGSGGYQFYSAYAGWDKGSCTGGSMTPVNYSWTQGALAVLGGPR
jgi:hypothetical protein